jgi:amino acid transporter
MGTHALPDEPGAGVETELRAGALKLPSVLMQGVTHIAPAVGMVLSLQFITSLAGVTAALAYLVSFVIIVTLGVSLTQLAKHLPSAGGYYTYVSRTVHPRAGWLTSWLYFLYDPTGAAINLAFMGYFWETTLSAEYPHSPIDWSFHWWLFFLVAGAFITFIGYVGIDISARTLVTLGAAEIAIIVALALWSLVDPGTGGVNVHAFNPANRLHGGNFFLAVVFTIFAFTGFESVAPLAEEAENPRRNLPRAIMGSILIMGAFYVLCAWMLQLGWGTSNISGLIGSGPNPIFTVAHRLWGGAWIIVFLAVINSILAVSVACNNAATRVFYGMARSGSLPRALTKISPRFQTPVNAVTLQIAIMFAFGLGVGFWIGPDHEFFTWGIALTLGLILVYAAGNVGVVRFFRSERRDEFNPFLHLILPVASTIAILVVGYKTLSPLPATSPEKYAWIPVLIWLVAGIAILAVMRSRGREEWLLNAGRTAIEHDAEQKD